MIASNTAGLNGVHNGTLTIADRHRLEQADARALSRAGTPPSEAVSEPATLGECIQQYLWARFPDVLAELNRTRQPSAVGGPV